MSGSLTTPLRQPSYRSLFSAHITALTATGLLNVALGLLAFQLNPGRAGTIVATALVIKIVIYVVAAPQLAAIFLRFPSKNILIASDLVRIGVGISLPFISAEWQLYVAVAVLQLAAATFTPTFQALIPRVVTDPDEYTKALSLSRIAYDAEQILSPVIAAALLAYVSFDELFGVAALGFVASAILVWRAGVGGVDKRERRARGGVAVMLRRRQLRQLLAVNVALSAPTALVLVNTVVLVRGQLGRSESEVAVLLGACGVGSIAMALVVPRLRPLASMVGGACGAVVGLLTFSALVNAAPHWPLFILLWAGFGAAMSAMATPMGQVIRRNTDESELGAVFAAQFSLSHACYLLAYPLAGWSGVELGLGWTSLLLAVIAAVAVVVAVGMRAVGSQDAGSQAVREPADVVYSSKA